MGQWGLRALPLNLGGLVTSAEVTLRHSQGCIVKVIHPPPRSLGLPDHGCPPQFEESRATQRKATWRGRRPRLQPELTAD